MITFSPQANHETMNIMAFSFYSGQKQSQKDFKLQLLVSFVMDAALLKGARYARSLCISKLKQNPPFIVRCSAHLLNVLCHDITTVLGAKVIIKQAGNLSGFFRRAGEENCGLPKKMATMTDVRWNSAYELLDSVAANRHYIEEYARRKKLTPLITDIILSIEFWTGLRSCWK